MGDEYGWQHPDASGSEDKSRAGSIKVGPKPRFFAVGEGTVWTLNQGDGSVSRVDPKTNRVVATIATGVPGTGGDIAVGEGSVWVTMDEVPLMRIDVATNKVVQQWLGPGGDSLRVGLGSVWFYFAFFGRSSGG
jgi:virginiamycin B lyase